jgi:hypothetical protein
MAFILPILANLQTITGRWRTINKENKSHDDFVISNVSGHLKGFEGKEVLFDGSWGNGPSVSDETCGYNLNIDAKLS